MTTSWDYAIIALIIWGIFAALWLGLILGRALGRNDHLLRQKQEKSTQENKEK